MYVQNDGFQLILTTENGIDTTNTIYLEPSVYQALLNYMDKCVKVTLTDDLFDNDVEIRNEDFEQKQS